MNEERDGSTSPKPALCSLCRRPKTEHTRCRICGGTLEHGHDQEHVTLEWQGLARMALAKQYTTRSPLTSIEREALQRHKHPSFLNGDTRTYSTRGLG